MSALPVSKLVAAVTDTGRAGTGVADTGEFELDLDSADDTCDTISVTAAVTAVSRASPAAEASASASSTASASTAAVADTGAAIAAQAGGAVSVGAAGGGRNDGPQVKLSSRLLQKFRGVFGGNGKAAAPDKAAALVAGAPAGDSGGAAVRL
mmetsp:Transcript_27487/g.67811  ORF Transcript_27487/g.67811 Transcript_27487/m.67811 type:complete len:152 (+) Transcript_27487:765-1220(+)